MLNALSAALVDADRDKAVRCIVLTGAGRGFCAGLDLVDQTSGDGLNLEGGRLGELDLRTAPPIVLHDVDTPTVCAVNGGAAGYGLDLALGCDIRIAAESAKLAAAFVRRGVLPESGGTWLLPRIVGYAKAAEIAFTGGARRPRAPRVPPATAAVPVEGLPRGDGVVPRAARRRLPGQVTESAYGPLLETRLWVATWNLWWRFGPWEARSPAIEDSRRGIDADVVCLQEVWGLDHGTTHASVLAERLGYHHVYAARAELDGVRFGNAVLSRWPIARSEERARPARPGAEEHRTVLMAEVDGPRGLRAVYDLRRHVERERQPTVHLGDDVRPVVLAVGGDPDAANQPELLDLLLSGELQDADDDFMIGEYRRMVDDGAAHFGEVLTGLTDPDGLPALFHCTAGKDRTGVAAALLLSVLGVDRETILDDYELSTRYRSERRIAELRPRLEASGVDVERVRPFLSARRPVLAATLAHLDDVDVYLTGPAGMAPESLAELRSLLLCEP